jgi:hypothetical protein
MAGKRPLVDRMVKGALRSWFSSKGDIVFTAYDLWLWMENMDMIPHSSNNFSHQMVGSRLSFWAKAGKVDGLQFAQRPSPYDTRKYRMVR